MTAVSNVCQASTSCLERMTALAVEIAEVLGGRNRAAHAPPVPDNPGSSSQRYGSRAGLIPRLQREDRRFVALGIIRPERNALTGKQGLAAAIHSARRALKLRGEPLGEVKNACLNDPDRVVELLVGLRAAAAERLAEVGKQGPAASHHRCPSARPAEEERMIVLSGTDREFWCDVLLAGGLTAVPRWTLDPVPGVGRTECPVPDGEVAALDRLAEETGAPLTALLLAAHARVLAALAGEAEVVTGYRCGADRPPLPCRVGTSVGSWRELVAESARAQAAVCSHADFPVEELRTELGLPRPFEAVVDVLGESGELPPGAVLGVAFRRVADGLRLVLDYRTDAVDEACAHRIAGYHLTALCQLAADPDADFSREWLLSAEELAFQLDWLAGPHTELPDARVHELVERRVREHPDAVAAVHRDRQLTYGELNARANRLARALLARGLQREEIVAVVTERDRDWLTAVLAVWKAGGAYLPLEPHFPHGRIAAALRRSGCRLVLTEHGSTATLDRALPDLVAEELFVDELLAEDHAEDDLGIPVEPDQLAYVLFTSGSTGEPKGVMCEHAGMLNHLFAKIRDLGIGEGEVVPQTGPQCFDISVWQLVAGLVLGGRTLLVDTEVVLDVERFVDTLVEHRAGVLQAVPSYLDVLLTYLEQHPRELPDLHCVAPTGDFLKKELVQRWFATQPGIPLVNTYGLTETSDDAVHEIMHAVPEQDRVPLGRPIINVRVDVVDEAGTPVPLGAPGLIVFSGVCVGRGYVNDPERTAAVFGPDPNRPGERVCRTGDSGRWLPDGKLDFLGRRDDQVKIRGFRIELGEIENALLQVAGVRDGAVVVAERADRSRHLVAFYSGADGLDDDALRTALAERLPDYMLPAIYTWQETLPLTGNGKIDRTALAARAADLRPANAPAADPPRTPTERRVAAAFASVLDIPAERIDRRDSFGDLGGTSLSAVKLAIALDRAVSLQDLARTATLADLAELLDERT